MELRGQEADAGTGLKVGFTAVPKVLIAAYGAPVDYYADRVSQTCVCKRAGLAMPRGATAAWLSRT
jgi:hypothetical protein